jgi:hypothetical protein
MLCQPILKRNSYNALNVGLDQLIYGNLNNRTDYFLQEIASLTDGFSVKGKLLIIDLFKALTSVLKDYDIK